MADEFVTLKSMPPTMHPSALFVLAIRFIDLARRVAASDLFLVVRVKVCTCKCEIVSKARPDMSYTAGTDLGFLG